MKAKTVITFGTFDILHVGHIRLLRRAADLGDRLVVGVSTDQLNLSKKGRRPIFPEESRLELVRAVEQVDSAFLETSLELKRTYIVENTASILVMGDDWAGKFDYCRDICDVIYLPRTPGISTTGIIQQISHAAAAK